MGAAARAPGEGPIHCAADQTASETCAGDVIERVRGTAHDGIGGTLAAADRRADPFAQIARGKARGIAGQECIADAHSIDPAPCVVAVAAGFTGDLDMKLPLQLGR